MIVTRPEPKGAAFAAGLRPYLSDVKVMLSPAFDIVPTSVSTDLGKIEGVVFTSAHGVGAVDLPVGLRAWCVGEKTAAAAVAAGFDVVVGPGDAAGLVDVIGRQSRRGHLAHIRGKHTRGEVAETLSRMGISCLDIVAYDQRRRDLTSDALAVLKGENPVVLPLFSPRTAAILASQGPFTAPLHLVVMSDAVKRAAAGLSAETVIVAAQPNEKAMQDATVTCVGALVQKRNG